jgi:predicted amidohydrolase YtcJ
MKLLFNAQIPALAASQPSASALLIDGERILAVGDDGLLDQVDGRAEKQDLGSRLLLPGLTDAHIHLQQYSLGLQKLDCETDTHADCLQLVAKRARITRPGDWILGHGWNQNAWSDPPRADEARVPGFGNAADLDTVAYENPVFLTAKSLHAAWVNSAALRQAGVTTDTPDPENGKIQRDEHGRPTGILLESAVELVSRALPAADSTQVAEAIREAQPTLWRMGLTGLHDFDRRICFMALEQLHERGELRLRVLKSLPLENLPEAKEIGLRSGFGDDWLRIGSIKVFMDGALGPRTAAMFQPYEEEPENRGILNMDGEQLFEIGCQATEAGLSLAVHAIGDRANHEVLEAYTRLRAFEKARHLPALRHRIEHVQIIHPDDAGRLGKLGIIASMQPIHATSDMRMADRYWGERASWSYAWRTQVQHGARLAFGSDAPVESPNPFWGLHAAVTRQRADGSPSPEGWYPKQKLSVSEALEGFTSGAAYAAGMGDRLGKLAPGYLADLIVLERDPFTCPPEELPKLQASATMIGGEWVWQS